MEKFRSILGEIQELIDSQESVNTKQLKNIWNDLSDAISNQENKASINITGWIEFNSNKELFNVEAKKNCLCKFEDGTVCRYNDEHPEEIMTHFKLHSV